MKRTKNKNEEAANLLGGNFEIKSWMYQGYVILFTVNVLNGFSNNLSFYIINEYANDAFKDMYFPNATSNNTDVHTESCAAHNLSDEEKTMGNTVQEKVSQWSVYCSMCSGIPSLVSTTILASLSDRYGRKKMLFIALFGTLLKMSFCSFAIWFKLNIYLMLVTSVLEGCAGGWVTVVSISFAYVADLTRPGKQRSFVLAAFELVRNTGFYLGTISCGYLVDYCGFFYPSAISAGAILCAIILLLCLPETIQNTTANKDQSVIEIVKKQLKELFIILVSKSENDPSLRSKYHIGICALICIWMGRHGLGNVELYYILSSPICFNLESVSLYLTLRNFGQQLVTVVAVKLFQLCIQDEQTAIVSTVFGIAYYSSFGISKDAITLYIAAAVSSLSFACLPLVRATMSKLTNADKQGSIFGALAVMENICFLVGTVSAGAIYSATVTFYKGFVFFVMAGFMGVAMILLIILSLEMNRDKKRVGYLTIQAS